MKAKKWLLLSQRKKHPKDHEQIELCGYAMGFFRTYLYTDILNFCMHFLDLLTEIGFVTLRRG
jgi:hypothetical protein